MEFSLGTDAAAAYISTAHAQEEADPPREYKVGDRILVNLHRGRIEEATITAIIERTSSKKLQVDFGKDMTTLIDAWQIVED